MKSFECIITDQAGIHARPAGALVNEAKQYKSTIKVQLNGKDAEATKLVALMSLGVKQGDRICVTADGDDEENAIEAMKKFFAKNF